LREAPPIEEIDDKSNASAYTGIMEVVQPEYTDTVVNSPESESNSHGAITPATCDPWESKRLGVAITYAIAIFPYTAENEGELDVTPGSAFVVFPQSSTWCIAQQDPRGQGIFDGSDARQGWVPLGCFLKVNVPIATAVAEARERRAPGKSDRAGSSAGSSGSSRTRGRFTTEPILPARIESRGQPGVILVDYKNRGEHELEVTRDTAVVVFKRYRHWSYAVKLVSGERGWLPVSAFLTRRERQSLTSGG
jgi:protein STE50